MGGRPGVRARDRGRPDQRRQSARCNALRVTSFYLGPGRPRLNTASWHDLAAAVESGSTPETPWCELKADVPASSPGANTELAKDLASLTVDGGVMLIGIKDDASSAADIVGVDDDTLGNLSSRIDQIAGSRVS